MPKLRDPLSPKPTVSRKSIALPDPLWAEIDRIAEAKSAEGAHWSSSAVASALLEWAVERYASTFLGQDKSGPGASGRSL